MRISDWSSDVCSSDLPGNLRAANHCCPPTEQDLRVRLPGPEEDRSGDPPGRDLCVARPQRRGQDHTDKHPLRQDRRSVGWGKRLSGRVALGGGGILKKTTRKITKVTRQKT